MYAPFQWFFLHNPWFLKLTFYPPFLSRSAFNLILLNLCIVCLVEALLNMIISGVYLASEPWTLGFPLCYVNSALMEYTPVVFTFFLATLAVDRAAVLRNPVK